MHRAALGQPRVFRMLHHRQIQFGSQLQCRPHRVVIQNWFPVVGDRNRSCLLQCAEIGKTLSLARARRRGNRKNVHHSSTFGTAQPVHPVRRIHNGRCIRHSAQGCESPRRCGRCTRSNRLFVTLPRLAQVDMKIDEPRRHDQSPSIKLLLGAGANFVRRSDLGHPPITQQQVHGRINLRLRIDDVPAFDQQTLVPHPQLPANFSSADSRGFRGFFLAFSNA